MATRGRVLVVEDDAAVRASLLRALALDGLEVEELHDGRAVLAIPPALAPDLVLLDLGLPGLDGLEVCRRLRARGDRTPVLMLTARDAVDDRVAGLDAGADDYLVKPFALSELRARIRALLRRAAEDGRGDGGVLALADLRLDPVTRDVHRGARRIELTVTEHALLRFLLEHPRQVLSRAQLFEAVWGYDFGATSNALGVYMGYLRRKTEAGGEPRLLHTVRGVGYVLREDA